VACDDTLDEELRRLVFAHVPAGAIDKNLRCVNGTPGRAARCDAAGGKEGIPKSQLSMR
jgi:hypothetical protein